MTQPEHTVVFVLSSNHSGSTLLTLLLGSHSQTASIGELRLMFHPEHPRTCSLCDARRTPCPLFYDIGERTPEDIYPILFERTSSRVLVDNSKKLWWMQQHSGNEAFSKRYIHLVRDPRGMFFSWQQRGRKTKPSHWVKRTRAMHEALAASRSDSKLVLYNELAENPEETLQEIDRWLGIEYESRQHEYWRVEHHGFGQNGATLAFFPGAGGADEPFYAERVRQRFHDLRWQERLDPATKRSIEEDPSVLLLLADFGLRFTDTGLARTS